MEEDLLPSIFCHFHLYHDLHFCWGYITGNLQSGCKEHDCKCYSDSCGLCCWSGVGSELSHVVASDGFHTELTEKTPSQCGLQTSQVEK